MMQALVAELQQLKAKFETLVKYIQTDMTKFDARLSKLETMHRQMNGYGLAQYRGIDFNPNQAEAIEINAPGKNRISTEQIRPALGPGPQAEDEQARMAQVRAAFIGADDDDADEDDFVEDA